MSNIRNTKLDFIRGISILIVILGHSIQVNLNHNQYSFIWFKLILPLQMPLMMFISGMAIVYSLPIKSSKQFIIKKYKRLLVPYIIWILIHNIITNKHTNYTIIEEIYKSDFWFLRFLFVFCVVFAFTNMIYNIIIVASKKKYNNITFSISIIFSTSIILILGKIPFIKESISVWYYFWFILGIIINLNYSYLNKLNMIYKKILEILFICIIFIYIFIDIIPTKLISIVLTLSTYNILGKIYKENNKINKIIVDIGNNTLPLYAIHWCLLFSLPFKIEAYRNLQNIVNINYSVSVLITFISWVIISALLTSLLKKSYIGRRYLLGLS